MLVQWTASLIPHVFLMGCTMNGLCLTHGGPTLVQWTASLITHVFLMGCTMNGLCFTNASASFDYTRIHTIFS